jgi:hypothetical protein
MCRNALVCLTKVVFVSECANMIMTHYFIFAFVSLLEFSLYCQILYPVANTAITETEVTFTNVHEAKHKNVRLGFLISY